MKQILLTNDDGFSSYGLLALRDALKDLARVVIVAPASEKSACGHGLSSRRLRVSHSPACFLPAC